MSMPRELAENLVDDGIVFVVDMITEALVPGGSFEMANGRDMFPKYRELLAFAREHKMPIVHASSQDYPMPKARFWGPVAEGRAFQSGTPGVEIHHDIAPVEYNEYEVFVPKSTYSAFYGTKLDVILRNEPFRGRNTAIITGMATNYCCLCTTIEAFNRDYDVVFVDDLNCTFDGIDGTPKEVMHSVTVETIKQGYAAAVLSADGLLERLNKSVSLPV